MTSNRKFTGVMAKLRSAVANAPRAAIGSGAALLMLMSGLGEAQAATQVPVSRLALLSRGVNADNIVNNSRQATYDSAAIAQLTAMGFTYVRIPIDPSYILAGAPVDYQTAPASPGRVASGLARLDQHIAMFVNAGLAVTLVIQPQDKLIALPVDQSEDIIRRSVAVLAARYASQYTPDQLFFEELNEPHYTAAEWNILQPQLLSTIRSNAPQHTVIIPPTGNDIDDNFKYLNLANDMNVIYTMHVYQPAQITSQGAVSMVQPNYRFPPPRRQHRRQGVDLYQDGLLPAHRFCLGPGQQRAADHERIRRDERRRPAEPHQLDQVRPRRGRAQQCRVGLVVLRRGSLRPQAEGRRLRPGSRPAARQVASRPPVEPLATCLSGPRASSLGP